MTDEARQITPARAISIVDHAANRANNLYTLVMRQRRIVAGQNVDLEEEPPPTKREWFRAERDAVTLRDSLAQLAYLLAGKDLDKEQPEFGMPPSDDYASREEGEETSSLKPATIMPADEEFEDARRRAINLGGEGEPFDWEALRANQRLREAHIHQMLREMQRGIKVDPDLHDDTKKLYDKKIEDLLRELRGEEG